MSADNGLGGKSDAELAAEREKAATDLWAVRDPNDPKHKELEKKYNDIERERFSRQGNDPKTYQYKHDARHEFRFEENKETGEKRAAMAERPDGSGPYTLRKRDEVINWRADTKVGERESAKAQQRAAGRTGDDAGHLVGAEFGADPADDRNLTRQNLTHNERGAWYKQERQLRDDVENGRQCGVDVSVKPYRDRSSRTMSTYDVSEGGKRGEPQGSNVEYVDFSTPASRAHAGGPPGRQQASLARKQTHERASEVEDNLKNQKPEDVQAWQRMKEERTGGPPPRTTPSPGSGGPPSRENAAQTPDPSPRKGRSR